MVIFYCYIILGYVYKEYFKIFFFFFKIVKFNIIKCFCDLFCFIRFKVEKYYVVMFIYGCGGFVIFKYDSWNYKFIGIIFFIWFFNSF